MTEFKTKNLIVNLVFFSLGIGFTFLAIIIGYITYEICFGIPLQTVYGKNHYATLRRQFGIFDYNLSIDVDGEQVYKSGDIWGVSERQLRTTLVWDKSGQVVALERMGKIVFAYNADEKRLIKIEETDNFCLAPMPEEYTEKHAKVCEPYNNSFGYQ